MTFSTRSLPITATSYKSFPPAPSSGPRGTDVRVEENNRTSAAERLVAYRTRHGQVDAESAESLEADDAVEAPARHRRPGKGGGRR